jgi:DNA topoisomerase-2
MTEKFQVLSDREHVLKRTNVYLGSVTSESVSGIINFKTAEKKIVPALIKSIEEVYQNSVDEYIRTDGKFATNISISFEKSLEGFEITVSDNGRGIPVVKVGESYQPVLAWTALRAGSNFDDTKRIGVGTNGMGAALTAIFSTSFIGETCDGTNKIRVTCLDNMSDVSFKLSKNAKAGTTVKFIPDLARFGMTEFDQDHMDILEDRFNNLAIVFPGIKFTFNGTVIKFKNLKAIGKLFHESAVTAESDNVGLVFAPAGEAEEFIAHSYVNGIFVKNGGSHVDFVMHKVIETLRGFIKKKHKIDVMPNAIRQHILFASWISKFPALKFDSQSKERITNAASEVATHLGDIDFDKISKQILNTPEILDPMIAAILYKQEMADHAAMKKKQKANAKLRVVNHIAATHPDPSKRTLFIVEGLSALGSLISVRDSKTIGAYPLKGKVMNTRGMKPIDILKNKEISELLSIIGLEFGKPATDLNYGRIAIMTDADVDGSAILSLLMNLFANWPELYDQGIVCRTLTPLYVCEKGKDTQLFYNKTEFEKFNSKGYSVSYIKGLGSLSKPAYKESIMQPHFVRLNRTNAGLESLEMAFGDSADRRKEWMLA